MAASLPRRISNLVLEGSIEKAIKLLKASTKSAASSSTIEDLRQIDEKYFSNPKEGYKQILRFLKSIHAKELGQGFGRTVFDLRDGTVIKVAHNNMGRRQNQGEETIWMGTEAKALLPVLEASDYERWVIMPKVKPATYRDIRNAYGDDALAFLDSSLDPRWESEEGKSALRRASKDLWALYKIAKSYKLVPYDVIKAESWGIHKGRPVLFDYGYDIATAMRMRHDREVSNPYSMEASLATKEASIRPDELFRSIDSLVKRNDGLWKSEKQGKFLFDALTSSQFKNRAAEAWAKKQKVPFMRAVYYQSSIGGFGYKNVSKIRMRGMVYLIDAGGVVLRGKVKIIHPKGGEGEFSPDWSKVTINFQRPSSISPTILIEDPDEVRGRQVKKNKPVIDLIKTIPKWEEVEILDSFMYQLSKGYTLSPAQMSVVKRMTPEGFSLSDREQWSKNLDKLIKNIVTKFLPMEMKLHEEDQKERKESHPRDAEILQEFKDAIKDLKTKGTIKEDWISREVVYKLEELVKYRAANISVYGDAFDQLLKQHKKAVKAKKPSKKALKIETFIQKAADKLDSMSKEQVYTWLEKY